MRGRTFVATGIISFACAFSTSGTVSAQGQRAFLDLSVNTESEGTILAVLDGSDVWLPVAGLREAGVTRIAGVKTGSGEDEIVSLASLAPNVTYKVDTEKVLLSLKVDASMLAGSTVNADSNKHDFVVSRARSGFFNYSYNTGSIGSRSISGELGMTLGSGLLTALAAGGNSQSNQRVRAAWRLDNPLRARRFVVGDVIGENSDWGDLGGRVSLTGVSFGRNFQIDPNGVHRQIGNLTGRVETPTTADLYVNGILTKHEVLPPGPFTFVNFPLSSGANDTRLVLKDAFGRERVYEQTIFASDTLLRRGDRDYAFAAGRPTIDNGDGTNGTFDVTARYRYGVTNHIEVGAALEHSRLVNQASASFGTVTRYGLFRAAYARSSGLPDTSSTYGSRTILSVDGPIILGAPSPLPLTGSRLTGNAMAFGWTYPGRRYTLGYQLRLRSPYYANVSTPTGDDRATREVSATLGMPLGRRTGLTVSYLSTVMRDADRTAEMTVGTRTSLGGGRTIAIDAGTRRVGSSFTPVMRVAFSLYGNHGTAITAESNTDQGRTLRSFSIARRPEQGTMGLGYSILANQSSAGIDYQNELDYIGRHFTGSVTADVANGQLQPSARVSGALVYVDGVFALTRPIESSYALLDTDGLSGIHVGANNRDVGSTDRHGRMIVTDLSEYRSNTFNINVGDAPPDYVVQTDQIAKTPMHRSAVHVHFPARRIVAYAGAIAMFDSTGAIVDIDNARLELRLGENVVKTDLGNRGNFYLENIDPGTYEATVATADGTGCRFALPVRRPTGAVNALGRINCTASKTTPVSEDGHALP